MTPDELTKALEKLRKEITEINDPIFPKPKRVGSRIKKSIALAKELEEATQSIINAHKLYQEKGKSEHIYDDLYRTFIKLDNQNLSIIDFYKIIHNSHPYMIPSLQNLIVLSLPRSSKMPWHFYYIFKPFDYLYEKKLISFIPATDLDKIDSMIKNLEEEVKFIHENKFRQILN